MFFNYCKQNGTHYVTGQEFIYGVKGDDVRHVKWNMGEPIQHETLADFKGFVVNLGVPAAIVDGITAKNRSWSRLDTLS